MDKTHFIAFDLGATSGRCILGSLSETGLELKELYRFPNRILHIGDRFFWNIFSLYEHILDGLKAASKENVHISPPSGYRRSGSPALSGRPPRIAP